MNGNNKEKQDGGRSGRRETDSEYDEPHPPITSKEYPERYCGHCCHRGITNTCN